MEDSSQEQYHTQRRQQTDETKIKECIPFSCFPAGQSPIHLCFQQTSALIDNIVSNVPHFLQGILLIFPCTFQCFFGNLQFIGTMLFCNLLHPVTVAVPGCKVHRRIYAGGILTKDPIQNAELFKDFIPPHIGNEAQTGYRISHGTLTGRLGLMNLLHDFICTGVLNGKLAIHPSDNGCSFSSFLPQPLQQPFCINRFQYFIRCIVFGDHFSEFIPIVRVLSGSGQTVHQFHSPFIRLLSQLYGFGNHHSDILDGFQQANTKKQRNRPKFPAG